MSQLIRVLADAERLADQLEKIPFYKLKEKREASKQLEEALILASQLQWMENNEGCCSVE